MAARWARSSVTALCASLGVGASAAQGPQDVETMVVTGTRLARAPDQSFQQVRSYDRVRIEASGQTTVADFLATVPEVSLNSLESTYISTTVRLRGAREGSTLILLNGRRTQPVSGVVAPFGFFDLNTIPLSMVERVDVLPSGSSAVYGGEALAGVVNIVLKSGFDGVDASLGYKSSHDTDEKTLSVGAGWQGDAVSFSLLASYAERSPLFGSEREITASPDYRRFGGPNLGSPFFGIPATIFATSDNLPGIASSFAAVPAGSTGVGLQPADFAATAGVQRFGSYTSYQSLVPYATRAGLFFNAEYRLPGGTELFAELLASHYKNRFTAAPPALLQASVPATNPFNPFGTTVYASGVVRGAESFGKLRLIDELVRPLIGARGERGAWDWEVSALSSRDHGVQANSGQANPALLNAALASTDPRTALNPFVDGPMAGPEVLAAIFGGITGLAPKGNATVINGFTRRSWGRLPAGAFDVVLGSEYEHGELAREQGMSAERSVRAAFAELHAPLLAGGDEGRELLALEGAARYDDYSDFGTENTWQLGVAVRPHEAVLLRATRSTAFKPPTLYNLRAPPMSFAFPVSDPRRGMETVVVQVTSGGNASLDPTTAESDAIGVVWSPAGAAGLDLSVTAWTLQIDRAIDLPDPRYIIANEDSYPGRVVRAAAGGSVGQILSVDRSYINLGSTEQQGFDVSAEWAVRTAAGELSPAIGVTYMTKFEGASAPGGPNVDRLSRANIDGIFAPRTKATASVGWQPTAALQASLAGRYVGHYYDYTPTRRLGDVWYVDAGVSIDLGALAGRDRGALAGFSVSVTGTNLADKLPPYSTHFRGYDVYNYDLLGRSIFVRLGKEF